MSDSVDIQVSHADKIVHVLFYFMNTLFFAYHFRKKLTDSLLFKISVGLLAYGMIIEVLQYVMPFQRAFEWYDMLANLTGILAAIVLIKLFLMQTAPENDR
nr:VanZ family protein [Robertkochia sp. 3YJGBD-33]